MSSIIAHCSEGSIPDEVCCCAVVARAPRPQRDAHSDEGVSRACPARAQVVSAHGIRLWGMPARCYSETLRTAQGLDFGKLRCIFPVPGMMRAQLGSCIAALLASMLVVSSCT